MKINFQKSVILILFCFVCTCTLTSQSSAPLQSSSKFEFGIGILINHSKINEDIIIPSFPVEGSYKVRRELAVTTRIGYKFSESFHLNSGIGFSWLGSLKKDLRSKILASTLEIPLLLEWNPKDYFHIYSGLNYNYVYGFSSGTGLTENDWLPYINTRHQIGLKHGIAVSHKLIEISLSYSHYFTDIYRSSITDVNGTEIGSLFWKFSNIQLGVIFRG